MKRKILKLFCMSLVLASLQSCSKLYTVDTFQPDTINGSDCPNPIYVGTMAKKVSVVTNISSDGIKQTASDPLSMTLYTLLQEAREKYDQDVTIHNVRWDIEKSKKKSKKISVIYDVIKCK